MIGDTILIKDISINGNDALKTASKLSETLTNNTINALGIDASSRTIWVNGQPYGNAYVNIKEDNSVEAPIGAEIFNDFEHNTASGAYSHAEGGETSAAGAYSHAEGKGTKTTNEAEHASGKYNTSHQGGTTATNTIHSVGIGTTDGDRKNAVEVMQNGDAYMLGIGGYDGKNLNSATKLQDAVSNSVNITWADLKIARDNGELVPGKQYRITDYTCTTTQNGTKAEKHKFDIIVTADDESTLNEVARAAKHEEDTYFSNSNFKCDLNAWNIWYCLDNDKTRFGWADDGPDGRGVIYRMIDEFGNDCPYDFKNIQFYRKLAEDNQTWSVISSDNTSVPCYTFSSERKDSTNQFTDMSLIASNKIYSNVINTYVNSNKQTLNNNCFFGSGCYSNKFENNCYNNTFGNSCSYNIVGNDYHNNILRNACNDNTFGNGCNNNVLGVGCYKNSFKNNCSYIKFADTSSAINKYTYYRYNSFGNGCQYILFKGKETASSNNIVQNYNFTQGLKGTDSDYLTIEGKRNRSYETYISKDTNDKVKESIVAEKLDKIIEISYDELYNLRDGAKLIPGQQYRIIDYTCTTSQPGTRSAGKVFDIIVTADSISTLNEEARAVEREGNGDFDESKLNAWKIWYCIDNDTTRFTWADSVNGKGVIYRMIDEFGNDCPYDFKNIQFYRKLGTDNQTWSVISSDNTGVPCYTFSSVGNGSNPEFTDMSLAASNNVYSNIINKYVKGYKQTLNNICFFGENCYRNTFGNNCFENTFRSNCTDNTFGNNCYSNTFGIECYSNTFENDCCENSFGRHCIYNSFGEGCNSNTLEDGCSSNSFGNYCCENTIKSIYNDSVDNDWYAHHNSFGNGCYNNKLGNYPSGEDINCSHNSFGNHCYSNELGDNCLSNSFANGCVSNTLGDNCLSNSFGNNCYSNTLGYSCTSNSFGEGCNTNKLGDSCDSNSFGNDCTNNKFGSEMLESQFGNAVQYFSVTNKNIPGVPGDGDLSSNTERLVVDNGVRYVNVYTTHIPGGDIYCKDVRICKGLNGTADNSRVSFNVDNVDNEYNYKESQLIVCYISPNRLLKVNIENLLGL